MTKAPPGGRNVNMSDWLTIKVRNSHQLKNGNNDQGVRGCKRVHQLQHVHPVLFNTQKIPEMSRSFTYSSAPLCFHTTRFGWDLIVLKDPNLCSVYRTCPLKVSGIYFTQRKGGCAFPSYLCDHWESQDEEGDAAGQGEERFVLPQILGKLIRNRGYDGLNGGKLKKKEIKGFHSENTH